MYVVEVKLSGALVEKEAITRDGMKIFLDYRNGKLVGGFHSTGRKAGVKRVMKLSGTGVRLVKHE